jgi:hypothetical protein
MSTLHTNPIKAVGQKMFEMRLSATEEITKLRDQVEKATNGYLDTICADLQRALAYHEAVEGLSSTFARMSEDNTELVLLRQLRVTTENLATEVSLCNNRSLASIQGIAAAHKQVANALHDALYDIVRNNA